MPTSHSKDSWQTPANIFEPLHEEFAFTLDGAADSSNNKLPRWYGPGGLIDDAFAWATAQPLCGTGQVWCLEETIWLNPPYSHPLQDRFILMARDWSRMQAKVVMLLPAKTDTKCFSLIWDRQLCRPQAWIREIRFLKERVKFVGARNGAKFPSMVVVSR